MIMSMANVKGKEKQFASKKKVTIYKVVTRCSHGNDLATTSTEGRGAAFFWPRVNN